MSESVYFAAAPAYDETLQPAIDALLSGCGLSQLVTPASSVILKANLLMKSTPEQAVTTHPAVVAAVISVLQKLGVQNITILDSPSGGLSLSRMLGIYESSGMAALETGNGVQLGRDFTAMPMPGTDPKLAGVEMMRALHEADLIINLAKLKTHAMTGLTGAVKNCFGAVPGVGKAQLHFRFPNALEFGDLLCAICLAMAPEISLVDAVVGMEGDGPSGGVPRAFGFVAAARNPFLLDRALCHTLGVAPERAASVAASVARALAPQDAGQLDVRGDRQFFDRPLTDLRMPKTQIGDTYEMVPALFRGVVRNYFKKRVPRPVIRKRDCVGCGRCAESCPQKIISIQDKCAEIKYANCIGCFCCHEVCPERAVDIKQMRVKTS